MLDLENYLKEAQTLIEIDINHPELPKINGMLIWAALAIAEYALAQYLLVDVPKKEKENLRSLQQLLPIVQGSTKQALKNYSVLFAKLKVWLQQLELNDVPLDKAIFLTKSTHYLLQALAQDSHGLNYFLRQLIPASLHMEINELLQLAEKKFNVLKQAKQSQLQQSLDNKLSLQPFDKLKELVKFSIGSIRKYTLDIINKQPYYETQLHQLTRLQACFGNQAEQGLKIFWQEYCSPSHFESLFPLLNLSQEETTQWRQAFMSQQQLDQEKSSMLAYVGRVAYSAYTYSKHHLWGPTLTGEQIQARLTQAIDALYMQVTPSPLRKEITTHKLQAIENNLKLVCENPLLAELLALQQNLEQPLPIPHCTMGCYEEQQQQLSIKAKHSCQFHVSEINKLRKQLLSLQAILNDLQAKLRLERHAIDAFFSQLHHFIKFGQHALVPLTDTSAAEYTTHATATMSQVVELYQTHLDTDAFNTADELVQFYYAAEQRLATQLDALQLTIQQFNAAGETFRQDALAHLKKFVKEQGGFWDHLFRLLSPCYRHCMNTIESHLLNNQQTSLEKISHIVEAITEAHTTCTFLVRPRIKALSQVGKYGFFKLPESNEPFGKDNSTSTPKASAALFKEGTLRVR